MSAKAFQWEELGAIAYHAWHDAKSKQVDAPPWWSLDAETREGFTCAARAVFLTAIERIVMVANK